MKNVLKKECRRVILYMKKREKKEYNKEHPISKMLHAVGVHCNKPKILITLPSNR